MNDFEFGNYIYNLRKKAKLSQEDLASYLGVTNKSISKWENGKNKPSLEILIKLAKLYNISIEKLLHLKIENKDKQIIKIVVTGSPCAGKTTAMSLIQKTFSQKGYKVLFVSELATDLINGGVAPWACGSVADFQKNLMHLQLEKEKTFVNAAKTMAEEKILIVCDRGTLDSKAYMSELEFQSAINELKISEVELRDSYDAIFHLVTAAKGAKEYYTLENNSARTETLEEAIIADDKLINAWTGHPHFRVIDNSSDFDNKMKRLIKEISSFLGEPEPLEIERKYLIKYPDIKWLESLDNCQKVDIIQTYLKSEDRNEIRIRQRGIEGDFIYYQTIKKSINNLKRVEIEKRLSKDEYLKLLMDADLSKGQIRKTRYCLTYNNRYFEIDVFPFWKDKAILEIELLDENEKILFPEEIEIIKEVTNEAEYKNVNLAKKRK